MSNDKKLIFNTAWCKGCGICVEFCPKHVLEIVNEKVQKVEGADCIYCGLCEMRCPDYALYIEEKEEEAEQWVKPY